jgi:hypothetical protein
MKDFGENTGREMLKVQNKREKRKILIGRGQGGQGTCWKYRHMGIMLT